MKKIFSIQIEKDLVEQIEVLAIAESRSRTNMIERILEQYFADKDDSDE